MDDKNQSPQPPQMPEPPHQAPRPQSNAEDAHTLKVARNLILVASLAGPVSLFIGGVFLGTAGLICGIIGYRKLSALIVEPRSIATAAKYARRSSIVAIVICSIAIVLNAVYAYIAFPAVLEMLQSGDYGNLAPGADLGTSSEGNSFWG